MPNRAVVLSSVAVLFAAAACGDDTSSPRSNTVNLTATLTPAGEGVALNGNTAASAGTFSATLDTVTNAFTYTVQFSGLSSNVSAGHIHGPFNPGQATPPTAGVILNFDPTIANTPLPSSAVFTKGATAGTAVGSVTLNAAVSISTNVNGDSLKKLLLDGKTYANIHTTNNPGGEIRGQIVIAP
jgi:hypothetical protein